MILNIPLTSEEEIDYTTVDSLKFSKTFKGKDRAKHVAEVFGKHYGVDVRTRRRSVVEDHYVAVEKYFITFRGYKNSVACIVGTNVSNLGPIDRSNAERSGCLFLEEKNVFPFRLVLEKIRQFTKRDSDAKRELELQQMELQFKELELKGLVIDVIGVPNEKVYQWSYGSSVGVQMDFNASSWEKSKVYIPNALVTIPPKYNLELRANFEGLSEPDVIEILTLISNKKKPAPIEESIEDSSTVEA